MDYAENRWLTGTLGSFVLQSNVYDVIARC